MNDGKSDDDWHFPDAEPHPKPPSDDASTSQRVLDRFLAHPRLSGIGALASILALVLAILAATGGFSDGAPSKTIVGQSVSEVQAKSAVEEIIKRAIWSSPPIPYTEANKAVGSREPLPTEGESITSKPEAVLATKLASEPEEFVRDERYTGEDYEPVIAVVGKVRSVETLTSQFVRSSADEEDSGPYPITQVELQVVGGADAVYVEFPGTSASVNEALIAVGRVAAIGSTHHNRIKAVYLLAERAETLAADVDSTKLRELYEDARRGKTEEQAEREKDESEIPRGGGVSLLP